jgi:hypothetical protein
VPSLEAGIEALARGGVTPVARTRLAEIARTARDRGIEAPWVDALEHMVAPTGRRTVLDRLLRRGAPRHRS